MATAALSGSLRPQDSTIGIALLAFGCGASERRENPAVTDRRVVDGRRAQLWIDGGLAVLGLAFRLDHLGELFSMRRFNRGCLSRYEE